MGGMASAALLFALLAPRTSQGGVPPGPVEIDRPRKASVLAAAGVTIGQWGYLQSAGVGYSPTPRLMLLVTAERNHVPSRVERHASGGSAFRGGTSYLIGSEVRAAVPFGGRVDPYVCVGFGIGVSRPNVNMFFTTDGRTTTVAILFSGGGIDVQLRPRVSLFVDGRLAVFADGDVIAGLIPVRTGLRWRF